MSNLDTPLTLEDQVTLMKTYVIFRQKTKMRRVLKKEGYFRVSRYGKYLLSYTPVLRSKPDQDLLLDLYDFDVALRVVFFKYTQKAELQIKNHIANAVSLKLNDPTFYLDSNSYTPSQGESDKIKRNRYKAKYPRFYQDLKKAENRLISKPHQYPELKDYRRGGPRYRKRIPAWTAFTYFDYGTIEHIYAYLRLDLKKEVLSYGYPNSPRKMSKLDTKNMDTWISAIRNLRNTCSHHNMLTGKTSSIVHLDKTFDSVTTLPNDTDLFSRMYALKKVLDPVDSELLKHDLKKLIGKTKFNIYILNILPQNWETLYDNIHKF
ncbi:Abi family protein [Fictibacillus sp. 5RED26]|uniref:Abi family protein n=1 Tax=Fictibacillus sp. 5RED26 TaxID=2745876 RepID=UPI0018CD437B|nr:Abi family protein [Fictibacillus sp. 5RED26]MBH0158586.1 Abi family protein [Fictibacillus sp. 5RED26]